jgi:hypothetical protein
VINIKRRFYQAALSILSGAGKCSAATYATGNDALAIEVAKINMAQAVTAAGQHV